MSTAVGQFITLEGIDGAGKSTHLPTIRAVIEARGREVVFTREPGGTPLGEKLRTILLNDEMSADAEALLIFAARAEHLARVIEPAIVRGATVVCDRFTDATFAYQGAGRGMAINRLAALENWVQRGRKPDLTLLFDVPVHIAMQRRKAASEALDRFEREQAAFFSRVRQGYLDRAQADPGRFVVVDGNQSIGDIKKLIEKIFSKH